MIATRILVLTAALISLAGAGWAQAPSGGGGGVMPGPDGPLHGPIDPYAWSADIRAELAAAGRSAGKLDQLQAFDRASADGLAFPLRPSPGHDGVQTHLLANFVDLNPVAPGALLDYMCGARTYDTASGYNHRGVDLSNMPFWWRMMDENAVDVVAAAGGEIIGRVDGNFDRNCSFSSAPANYIRVLQDDGLIASYLHLKSGSLRDPALGDRVEAGDYLGQVGSSGSSTAPHLHFELNYQDAGSGLFEVVDPYAGICGATGTLWRHQPDYHDATIVTLHTHDAAPVLPGDMCQARTPNLAERFEPGQAAYWAVYLRGQRPGETIDLRVYRPNGTLYGQWTIGGGLSGFAPFSYWYVWNTLPFNAPTGVWRMRAEFQGQVLERGFMVGADAPSGARVRAAVLPASRSVRSGHTATAFATVINPGANAAEGCRIHPDQPFHGEFAFVETDPATNAVIGTPNQAFSLAGGGSRAFVLSVTPDAAAEARSLDLTLRYDCLSSDAAPVRLGLNSIRLSFEDAPIPDIIAIAATPSADGVLRIPGENAAAAFALATSNVGSAGALTLRPRMTGGASPTLTVCQTDPGTGACLGARSASLTRSFAAGETASFAVYARSTGAIGFDPAGTRLFVEIEDADGVSRGSTSVAVRTD
jgi:murein DD-endopeptidase MepM/ murein hydrolase activator NlpD